MTHIGVVGGWQADNIGDVAHVPGTLIALQRRHPHARLSLLVQSLADRELAMLTKYFPQVELITDPLAEGAPTTETMRTFLDSADILVHASGPSLVADSALTEWHRRTGKPYGIFGITVDPLTPYVARLEPSALMVDAIAGDMLTPVQREIFSGAAFLHCRDTLSLKFLQGQGIGVDALRFGPDATVVVDVYDDDEGAAVTEQYGLVAGEYLCVVPRIRRTPYYQLRNFAPGIGDWRKQAYSAGFIESDFDSLRRAVNVWARRTGKPVLVVPEMRYEVELAQQYLAGTFDPAIADQVKILPRYWELQEACAVYRHSAGVISMECHSPLMAIAEGVPTAYLRQPTDTIKGQMYHDLGMGERLIELDHDDAADRTEAMVTQMLDDPDAERERVAAAQRIAAPLLETMADDVTAAIG